MDIELMLQQLLNKYGLNKKEEISYVIKSNREHIKRQWDTISNKKRIAIWCAGGHTQALLKLVDTSKKNIVCIIDKNKEIWGQKIQGINIISKDQMELYNIDIVVISTISYIEEIECELNKLGYEYLNFYKNVNDSNITSDNITQTVCWQDNIKSNFRANYVSIFLLSDKYEKEKILSKKEIWLTKLIIEYLNIKDFVYGKIFINKYIQHNFKNSKKYRDFLLELDTLLNNIKHKMSLRVNNDFIFIFCDALRFDVIEDCRKFKNDLKFFNYISNNSVYYLNAFANSTYTRASFKSIFEEELVIDDKGYQKREYCINVEDSELFKGFLKKNYKIVNNSVMLIKDEKKNNNIINNINDKFNFETCPEQLWKMLSCFCKHKDNIFVINQFMESHRPYISGGNTKMSILFNKGSKILKKQCYESIMYIDKQLEFYYEFFPKNSYKIFTSDHGQTDIEEDQKHFNYFSSSDYVTKTPLCILQNGLKNEIRDELFSKINLSKLILKLITTNKIHYFDTKFVNIQRDEIYNIKVLGLKEIEEVEQKKYVKAFKAIRTLNEKYVLYDDGSEEFYILPNEEMNEIDNPTYKQLINEIKGYLKNKEF
ncbi:hypothetical protein ACQPVA_10585 [Clostridium butyricum]|uniref:nucleoside-diphosphate sugar epimerase/dehydratase n=1 Tax=Clostridium butyricum TaxID=1492 RepID=UPI003D34346E